MRRLAQKEDGSRPTVVSVLDRALFWYFKRWRSETRVGSETYLLMPRGRAETIRHVGGLVHLDTPHFEASVADDAEPFLQGDTPLGRELLVLREPLD